MAESAATKRLEMKSTADNRVLKVLFYAAGAVFALVSLALVYGGWRDGVSLTPTSGTWIALAVDLKHGMFYRPMYSDLGMAEHAICLCTLCCMRC